ncbi:coniferyl aldehyde dehydrogenase [Pseudomonas fluorescens]|uniref:coniferyl aldehyde dehydrogenase n=1 Tax=Pseudomonas fluorescens TaxID=294 RepID=UPI001BE519B7|nr:coniferyl aldehyde dehydrogenase [Pseudomonas fluorescens]MBT2375339.1 coniferyl aldehyde dehydrogenase [Pseudomonas fluorescens]
MDAPIHRMHYILDRQRLAQIRGGAPDAALRIDRLDRAIRLLVEHAPEIAWTLREDFGHRSFEATLVTDVAASIDQLKYAKRQVHRWMRRERRRVSPAALALLGARAWVDYQPKGVVGLISTWNFPFNVTFAPLAGMLAAGNRVMIKPSEFAPRSSELLHRIVAEAFDESEIAVITGGPDVGCAFSALPFDHMLFTGGASTARHVMRAASEHLVPVTLELGGKSPAIIGREANLDLAATRIIFGKTLNAGQVCVAPDYALVPKDRVGAFVDALARATKRMFPSLQDNDDYTSIINDHHHARLLELLDDARDKGATLRWLHADHKALDGRRIAPVVILDADDGMAVMQDEIFGPLLPVLPYDGIEDAIARVNAQGRPLALYYFGENREEQERVLSRIVAGGVTINDTLMHLAMCDLPFGGIGPSGMGAYHGFDGFRTFSHARGAYRQACLDVGRLLRPPYGAVVRALLHMRIRS